MNRFLAALLALACAIAPAAANDLGNSSWSETDGSNNAASPNGWTSGTMLPNQVEPTARAMMGALKRDYDHRGDTLTSAGTANAQTLTYSVAPAAYGTGDIYRFKVGVGLTNTGAATVNVNALGAKAVQLAGQPLVGGELVEGQLATVAYDGTNFQLLPQPTPHSTYWAPAFVGAVSGTACTWDSTHDVGDCINNAIAAAVATGTAGGTVLVPIGTYGVSTMISETAKTGVTIEGAGANYNYGVCKTTLKWIGSAGGTVVSIAPASPNIVGGGLRYLCIEGNASAAIGVKLRAVAFATFDHVDVENATSAAWDIDALDSANGGVSRNLFIDDNITVTGSANGWQIGQAATVTGLDTFANTWIGGMVTYASGVGFQCGAADSNQVIGMDIQPGTGRSLTLLGNDSVASNYCFGNRFLTNTGFGNTSGTAPRAMSGTSISSASNYIYQNQVNGGTNPVVDSGATLTYETSTGFRYSNVANTSAQLPQYRFVSSTVAGLQTCSSSNAGALGMVTDASAPTIGSAVVGGGASKAGVFCTGSAWDVFAK